MLLGGRGDEEGEILGREEVKYWGGLRDGGGGGLVILRGGWATQQWAGWAGDHS